MKRTSIYIDGFNLYHGALRHTDYKWLDPVALVKSLIGEDHRIVATKYFTARVGPRTGDPGQPFRQHIYLRALSTLGIQIIYGRYLSHVVKMYRAHQSPGVNPFVDVVKTEEKGTDVNIASHMLIDAADDLFDCAVLVSGDSDLTTPVKLCIGKYGKAVGVLNPAVACGKSIPADSHRCPRLFPQAAGMVVIRSDIRHQFGTNLKKTTPHESKRKGKQTRIKPGFSCLLVRC